MFAHFGLASNPRDDKDGETRLLGNGGLLLSGSDPAVWYNFSDEMGGGVIEAWGWCRYGSAFNSGHHLRNVLLEMAHAAGIDAAAFYRRGDERMASASDGDRQRWSKQHPGRWGRMRSNGA